MRSWLLIAAGVTAAAIALAAACHPPFDVRPPFNPPSVAEGASR